MRRKRICFFITFVLMILGMEACGSETVNKREEITSVGMYEEYTLELGEATFEGNDSGDKIVKVTAFYSNNSTEPAYAYCSFAVRAYQNDEQLDEISDINGDEAALIKEVKNGASVTVVYLFRLKDDSAVEVLIGEPTADQTTVGKKIYFGENS